MRVAQAGAGVMEAAAAATFDVVVVAGTAPRMVAAVQRPEFVRAALQALLRATSHRPPLPRAVSFPLQPGKTFGTVVATWLTTPAFGVPLWRASMVIHFLYLACSHLTLLPLLRFRVEKF